MRSELRRRVGLALFGLSVAVGTLVGGVLWFGHAWMEQTVLASILQREAASLLAAPAAPGTVVSTAQGISLYEADPARPDAMPAALRRLAPGSHRDVHMDGREFHVLVGERGNGQRYYLAYDVTRFAQRERWLIAVVAAALALAALLSLLAARAIAQRLTTPVDSLVARIRALDRERLQPLQTQPGDRQFGAVIEAINGLVAEIEQRVQRERAFAAAAGHELRTPLTSIRIAADMIAPATEADRERLRRVQRAVTTASATLDTLLQAARGSESEPAGALALHEQLPVWAEPWLAGTTAQVRWQLAEVRAAVPAAAFATIFTNLLRNALKAAPEGHITVTLEAGCLRVADDGDGIDPALLAHVFEPGTHGRAGGSGIGLYLSRLLAQRQNWTLDVRNGAHGGAVAELRF
ncbi:HAMP domain-containing sensor histidine kinase [Fontimonas sp. SYSU GA230001]|uniref:sensor histidine kinase n=1 Tax=Fontimonas sp. SYSU GA230001 TaxID=3142450 RepID=UPI0032B3E9B5